MEKTFLNKSSKETLFQRELIEKEKRNKLEQILERFLDSIK